MISLGTDTTDLVITNGYRVWQRSIPIGGNHFTKALTKELKLTFAKAEHLKRNATKAEDPKAVFQAMRPVFNDLVTEIQRSIGFFTSIDRNAKIGEVIALGNADEAARAAAVPGAEPRSGSRADRRVQARWWAAASPRCRNFKENVLTFGVAYGLCVQALDKGAAAHQPAAGRDHHQAAGPGEEAVGRGGGGAAADRHGGGLCESLLVVAERCGEAGIQPGDGDGAAAGRHVDVRSRHAWIRRSAR